MATLIRRSEALGKLNKMEEKYRKSGDQAARLLIVRCYNMIMSCKVEERVFCARCGKPVKTAKIPEDGGE